IRSLAHLPPPLFPYTTLFRSEDARGIDIASSGSGSTNHLLILQFGQATGAHVNHVPYRGAGPAMTDTIAGVVPMMSDSLPSAAEIGRAHVCTPVTLESRMPSS